MYTERLDFYVFGIYSFQNPVLKAKIKNLVLKFDSNNGSKKTYVIA